MDSSYVAKMPSTTALLSEMNNNNESLDGIYRPRSESRASTVSTASSSNETSEELDLQEMMLQEGVTDDSNESPDTRRFRSMSDGSPILTVSDSFEVFPSLPDSVLEKMGLLGDRPKERLNEEESEQKFVALALAFSIDSTTINDRCQRQRRYRDQTETNLATEIDRLVSKAYRLQPLCTDAESAEMLADILAQADIVMRAAAYAAIAAERFGAVQHEDRIAQAVELMIKHVTLLKQQRDSARKHLQYTKRMLQNTNNLSDVSAVPKTKTLHSRRASIAIISQQTVSAKINTESKRITRRTSELSIRASALPRSSRPSRLELGVDLVKIREGAVEETAPPSPQDEDVISNDEVEEDHGEEPQSRFELERKASEVDLTKLKITQKAKRKLTKMAAKISGVYKRCCDDGRLHELLIVSALMCFSLGVITLGNILVELQKAKGDSQYDGRFWSDPWGCVWTNFLAWYTGSNYDRMDS